MPALRAAAEGWDPSPKALQAPRHRQPGRILIRSSPANSTPRLSPGVLPTAAQRGTESPPRRSGDGLGASCAELKETVMALVDFHRGFVDVWVARVARLDGRRKISAADAAFLERGAGRLSVYLEQVRAAAWLLEPYTQGPLAVSKWGRYAQRLMGLLAKAEAAAACMQSCIVYLLATSAPAVPESPRWSAVARTLINRSRRVSPVKTYARNGAPSSSLSAKRGSLDEPSSFRRQSNTTPSELLTSCSASTQGGNAPRVQKLLQSSALHSDESICHLTSSRRGHDQEQQQHHLDPQIIPTIHRPSFSSHAIVSSENSSEAVNRQPASRSRVSGSTGHSSELRRVGSRLPERRIHVRSSDGNGPTLIPNSLHVGIQNPLHNEDRFRSSTSPHSKRHQNIEDDLSPHQPRALLERINTIEKLPYRNGKI